MDVLKSCPPSQRPCHQLSEKSEYFYLSQDKHLQVQGGYAALLNRHTLTQHRQFIQASYPLLKKNNPDLPVLIREVQDTPARVFARFGVSSVFLQYYSRLSAHSLIHRARRREACRARQFVFCRRRKTGLELVERLRVGIVEKRMYCGSIRLNLLFGYIFVHSHCILTANTLITHLSHFYSTFKHKTGIPHRRWAPVAFVL